MTAHTTAPPDRVLDLLHRAEVYPMWVVGTRRVIDVEAGWPAPGTVFFHEVGLGPMRVRDRTRMVVDEGDRLVLDARAQPLGRARVELRVIGTARGGSTIALSEEPVSGPARLIPRIVLDPLTRLRNRRSLARLRRVAERGGEPTG